MKHLYWKIVLSEGIFLLLILGAAMWALDLAHQSDLSRRTEERMAAVEFLHLGLGHGLAEEIPLFNLEKIASRLFKSDVRIVELDGKQPLPTADTIRFSQGGKEYGLFLADQAPFDGRHSAPSALHGKSAGILLVLAVALGLLAIPIARIVTRPLGQLRKDMRRFASGDLAHRTQVSSRDEVGEAARDFNEMADSIQTLIRVGQEMTAHVSHELRSPLTRIDLARQMLEEQLSGRPLVLLESIREDVKDMDVLIERILRLSRLELNESVPSPLCLAEILREALSRHEASFQAAAITLRTELPRSLPGLGVREDLACLVDNLLGNALKFTPRGGRMAVSLAQDRTGTVLTVANEAGEPAIDPQRLAEPFQRGGVSESVPGSGLGLAIVRKVVHNHGGELSLAWREGTFVATVTLSANDMKAE